MEFVDGHQSCHGTHTFFALATVQSVLDIGQADPEILKSHIPARHYFKLFDPREMQVPMPYLQAVA